LKDGDQVNIVLDKPATTSAAKNVLSHDTAKRDTRRPNVENTFQAFEI
jgi:hypothetical protein